MLFPLVKNKLGKAMSTISPLLGVSKIIDQYSTLVVGFDGVIYNGNNISYDAIKALAQARLSGKEVVLLSNSAYRVQHIINIFKKHNVPLNIFSLIMTAGEMVHYMLKKKSKRFAGFGKKYYRIGNSTDIEVMSGLEYERVTDINNAEFIFVGGAGSPEDTAEANRSALEYATTLSLPMLCVGNDILNHIDGQICNAPGAFAEQYAVMGGAVYTYGKPDQTILQYVLETFPTAPEKLLIIGDNIQTDIKMANLCGADSILISKGVHINFLGEGYIPDVKRAAELAANYEVYPKYILSDLRW